jgi:hypothetical protein
LVSKIAIDGVKIVFKRYVGDTNSITKPTHIIARSEKKEKKKIAQRNLILEKLLRETNDG